MLWGGFSSREQYDFFQIPVHFKEKKLVATGMRRYGYDTGQPYGPLFDSQRHEPSHSVEAFMTSHYKKGVASGLSKVK